MVANTAKPDGNCLLAALAPAELARLRPNLDLVLLPQHQVLSEPHKSIDHAYFPQQGFISLVQPNRPECQRPEPQALGAVKEASAKTPAPGRRAAVSAPQWVVRGLPLEPPGLRLASELPLGFLASEGNLWPITGYGRNGRQSNRGGIAAVHPMARNVITLRSAATLNLDARHG